MEKEKMTGSVIVAMKGPPCSGKTKLAKIIAKTLKYLLITQDGCEAELQQSLPNFFTTTTTTTSTSTAEALKDLSFNTICQIASTQLHLGHRVIIDSSHHSQAHLDMLLQLSSSTGARLVMVECQPRDKYLWQQRLFERDGELREWKDLDRLLEIYDGCNISNNNVADVSKLLVNTTHNINDWDLTSGVKYLASCPDIESMDLHDWATTIWQDVEPELWRQEKGKEEDDDAEKEKNFHFHQLILTKDHEHSTDKQNSCRGCLEAISGPTYYKCGGCDLSVHKSCAELPERREISPNDYPAILREIQHQYSFPEVHKCSVLDHDEDNEDLSECRSCLFETHLRCALLPSVLPPKYHQHALYITIYPISFEFGFRCQTCGDLGEHVGYKCFECRFICHLNCALLPHAFKEEHHRHPLTLTSSRSLQEEDDSIDIFCDACEEIRNPKHWTYYCAEPGCEFRAHLKCMRFGPG